MGTQNFLSSMRNNRLHTYLEVELNKYGCFTLKVLKVKLYVIKCLIVFSSSHHPCFFLSKLVFSTASGNRCTTGAFTPVKNVILTPICVIRNTGTCFLNPFTMDSLYIFPQAVIIHWASNCMLGFFNLPVGVGA